MTSSMIKPHRLRAGDKVATVTLSWGGPGTFPHRYQAGKQQLEEEFGITVVEMPHTLRDAEWIANNPKARADDLMQAFADPSIQAIISTIGGDDSIRVFPFLDLDVIRDHPKIFLGYSDTTVSHLACFKAGLVSFYGPSIMAGFAENGGLMPYMVDAVHSTLFSAVPRGVIPANSEGWTVEYLEWAEPENQTRKRQLSRPTGWKFLQGSGVHRGHLLGGCFDVLEMLRGTDMWPTRDQWQDAILFLETSEEAPPPAKVLRGLRTYAAMGIFEQVSGILFGRPGGGVPPEHFPDYDQVIVQVVAQEQGLVDLPIVTHMDFGHTDPMTVLPYGIEAEIDCDQQQIALLENAVVDEHMAAEVS